MIENEHSVRDIDETVTVHVAESRDDHGCAVIESDPTEVCLAPKVRTVGGIKFDEEQWNDMEKCGAVGGCIMSGMMKI